MYIQKCSTSKLDHVRNLKLLIKPKKFKTEIRIVTCNKESRKKPLPLSQKYQSTHISVHNELRYKSSIVCPHCLVSGKVRFQLQLHQIEELNLGGLDLQHVIQIYSRNSIFVAWGNKEHPNLSNRIGQNQKKFRKINQKGTIHTATKHRKYFGMKLMKAKLSH